MFCVAALRVSDEQTAHQTAGAVAAPKQTQSFHPSGLRLKEIIAAAANALLVNSPLG